MMDSIVFILSTALIIAAIALFVFVFLLLMFAAMGVVGMLIESISKLFKEHRESKQKSFQVDLQDEVNEYERSWREHIK